MNTAASVTVLFCGHLPQKVHELLFRGQAGIDGDGQKTLVHPVDRSGQIHNQSVQNIPRRIPVKVSNEVSITTITEETQDDHRDTLHDCGLKLTTHAPHFLRSFLLFTSGDGGFLPAPNRLSLFKTLNICLCTF